MRSMQRTSNDAHEFLQNSIPLLRSESRLEVSSRDVNHAAGSPGVEGFHARQVSHYEIEVCWGCRRGSDSWGNISFPSSDCIPLYPGANLVKD